MPHRPLEDWEDPEPDDEDEEESESYECPSCGASVYEDAEQCPRCGDYITPRSRSSSAPGSPWFMLAVFLMLAVMLAGTLYFLF
ncbi:MAG: hypothetical protein HYX69_00925 [Planctomycetia bacterium]|nr:hypothetical protein [Planctomycetia bacterium]